MSGTDNTRSFCVRPRNEVFLSSVLWSVRASTHTSLLLWYLGMSFWAPWSPSAFLDQLITITHRDVTTGYWILWTPTHDYDFPPESISRMSPQDPRASFQKLPKTWAWLYICFYQTVIVPLVFDFLRHHYAVTITLVAWRAGHTTLLRTAAKFASGAVS